MVLMATNDIRQQVFESEFYPELDALYGFACRLTSGSVEAEDLVQDTYERAYKAFGQYKQGTNAKAWLFKIMKNHFINGYRKKSRRPKEVDSDNIFDFVSDTSDTDNPCSLIDWNDENLEKIVGDEVLAALKRLSYDFRIVIMLDLQDFKYEEIAEALVIPIGTVRSRLYRAREKLATDLKDYADNNGYTNNRK